MKKIFLTLALTVVALAVSAIPAKPGIIRTLTLSDGTTVKAQLVGDEHGHYWLTQDGRAYQQQEGTAYFSEVSLSSVTTKAQARRSQSNARRTKRLAPRRVGEVGAITGKKKGIIILVNFSNVAFQEANTNALYQRIANEKNFSYGDFKGSMYDYFYAQSEGQFELTFDVVGPVKVSQTQSYYGANDSQGNDKYPAKMVIEALKLVDDDVNFADYDWDGDGEVDQVYVIYAGKGEADGGASTTIWPHEWELSSAASYGDGSGAQTLDGVRINTYACGGELNGQTGEINGIGTMCHEFSHCLGYPDFYDTDYSGGQGMFEWDLMDSGSYNGDGYQPAGYTSYERWVAGWKEPIELTTTTQVSNLKSLQEGGSAYIFHADMEGINFRRAFKEAGFHISGGKVIGESKKVSDYGMTPSQYTFVCRTVKKTKGSSAETKAPVKWGVSTFASSDNSCVKFLYSSSGISNKDYKVQINNKEREYKWTWNGKLGACYVTYSNTN